MLDYLYTKGCLTLLFHPGIDLLEQPPIRDLGPAGFLPIKQGLQDGAILDGLIPANLFTISLLCDRKRAKGLL